MLFKYQKVFILLLFKQQIEGQKMVESQTQTKEVLKEEIDLNFFIQFVEVKGKYTEYYKLYAKIKDTKVLSQSEISYQHLSPENLQVREILKQIEKLYNVYKFAQNEKLMEGAREEILKLITLLIWNVYHWEVRRNDW